MTLVALALMPFSMAGAPAAAIAATPAAAGHCDDHQKPADAPAAPKVHCAACAALPAVELSAVIAEIRPAMLRSAEIKPWVAERGPEMDDPPPKMS